MIRLKNRLLICFALGSLTLTTYSQSQFKPGYIVTTDSDTLVGLVDYREGKLAHKRCSFKVTDQSDGKIYSPDELIGYGFENDAYYISKGIRIKDSTDQKMFLEVLIAGTVNLYRFERTYYVGRDNEVHELVNESVSVNVNGQTVVKKLNQHLATLNRLMPDCPDVSSSIAKISLSERPLTRLVESYNLCVGDSAIVYKEKKPWAESNFSLAIGVVNSDLSFKDTEATYYDLFSEFDAVTAPMFGVLFDVRSPRLSQRISFHSGLFYTYATYHHYSEQRPDRYTVKKNNVTVSLTQLKLPIGIRYCFPLANVTPFFTAGISTTTHLSSSTHWFQEVTHFDEVTTSTSDNPFEIKRHQTGLWGSIGALKSVGTVGLSFEFRYERTNGIVPFTVNSGGLRSNVTNYQLVVGLHKVK